MNADKGQDGDCFPPGKIRILEGNHTEGSNISRIDRVGPGALEAKLMSKN